MLVKRDTDGMLISITMLRPSNFHAHLRLKHLMEAIAYELMWLVKYLLVMPNDGVIDTIEKVVERHAQLTRLAEVHGVKPTFIMTLYLTANVTPQLIERIERLPFKVEVKYYPPEQGATTGSGFGIPLSEARETLRAMTEHRIPLLGHFESVRDKYGRLLPPEERETYFLRHEYPLLREAHPDLLVCIEHASTSLAVTRVKEDTSGKTVCTFTPHHLLLSINELRQLSWANHGKCMPIPKGPDDVAVCLEFATADDPRTIAGDDTAAHLAHTKEGPFEEAANGAFWTAHSIAAYASAFEKAEALDERFEQFMSINGAKWRGLKPPAENDTITIRRETRNDIPDPIKVPEERDFVVPLGWAAVPDRLRLGLAVER